MRRHLFLGASVLGIATAVWVFTSCSTPQTRISNRPDLYQNLSARDQALVSQGQLRSGMSRSAVWLAWGSPDQKVVGNMAGTPTETWIIFITRPTHTIPTTALGLGDLGVPGLLTILAQAIAWGIPGSAQQGDAPGSPWQAEIKNHHGGRSFVFFGSPFYDPFYWSHIPPSIPYPGKVVTFVGIGLCRFNI